MSDFDWTTDGDSIVLAEQPATAVYTNPAGAIVIRRQADMTEAYDDCIFILPENALAVARAILRETGIDIADLGECVADSTSSGCRQPRGRSPRTTHRTSAPIGPHPLGVDIGWTDETDSFTSKGAAAHAVLSGLLPRADAGGRP